MLALIKRAYCGPGSAMQSGAPGAGEARGSAADSWAGTVASQPSRRMMLAGVGLVTLAVGWGLDVEAQTPPAEIAPPKGLDLTPAQRQLIYASISQQTHQSTASPANFGPAIGARVPEAVALTPMPDTIVEVVPQTRGHQYAFVQGQVLIVNPSDRIIVELVAPDKPSPTRT